MANHFHEDSQGTEFQFQNNPGDSGGSQRVPVFDLIATIKTQFSSMVSSLSSIVTAITGTLTVGLPSGASTAANQSTGNTTLSSILSAVTGVATAANQATANSSLSTIATAVADLDGNTDGLEALIGTTNSTLSTVIASLDPGSGHAGQNTDVDQASESVGSQSCTLGAWVKNISTGTQKLYINYSADGSATTSNGWELAVGEEHFFPCSNVNELNAIASADNAKLCWRTE